MSSSHCVHLSQFPSHWRGSSKLSLDPSTPPRCVSTIIIASWHPLSQTRMGDISISGSLLKGWTPFFQKTSPHLMMVAPKSPIRVRQDHAPCLANTITNDLNFSVAPHSFFTPFSRRSRCPAGWIRKSHGNKTNDVMSFSCASSLLLLANVTMLAC